MTAAQLGAGGGARQLRTMLHISVRIQRRRALSWILLLSASMVGTAASIAVIYDTPAKIHSYATAVTTGSALAAINGKVEGIDSLGGVIQDEFGFLAAFLLPLLGISLVAAATRREEESGRLELLLAGRIARHGPALGALLIAAATIAATTMLFAAGLGLCGVPLAGAVLYALSLGALAFVFAGLAAVLAQLILRTRGVYTWSLLVLAVSYVLRGVGDVTGTWLTWLSPLGWAERAAPFGDQRWWTLSIPLAVGLGLGAATVWLATRRDLGSALVRGGAGPDRAAARLSRPIGLAIWTHRPAILGWLTGSVLLAGMLGALAQQLLDAIAGNPALSQAMDMARGRPVDEFVAATQIDLAVVAVGYVIQAIGTLRTEEADGRLETQLSGTVSRARWLGAHTLVALAGMLTIVLGSSLTLGVGTALSMGEASELGPSLSSGLAYLPAELVLAGLALALYGLRPSLFALAWVGYGAMSFIALLGPSLKLPQWVLELSPTTHVGNPPAGPTGFGALGVLAVVAAGLIATGFVAFGRRDVPQC